MSRREGSSFDRALRLPAIAAAMAALFAGCHLAAVPLASATWRPRVGSVTPAAAGLEYRDLLLRGAQGVSLPAWLVGAGRTEPRALLVLLAENGGTRGSPRMIWLAGELSRMGFEVLLVDLRGHGDSGGVNTYGLGETLDLLEVLEELQRGAPGRRIGAVGFSLGAACILRAMSLTDAIQAAACFASYGRLHRDLIRHELEYQSSGTGFAWLARALSPRLLQVSLELWAGFPRLPEPAELRTERPVILFHCTADPEIPFAHARLIAEKARAPLLELHPVARDSHIPPLGDRDVWDSYLRELRRLLDRAFPDPLRPRA